MAETHSSDSQSRIKPEKPRKDFPLYAHPKGKWAKTIRGKKFYFGTWEDPDAALSEYLKCREDLERGHDPRRHAEPLLTVRRACNLFLEAKEAKRDAGELSGRMFQEYFGIGKRLVEFFGPNRGVDTLEPADFQRFRKELAKRLGVHRLRNEIVYTKSLFKWLYDTREIEHPIVFGPELRPPSPKVARKHKREQGDLSFSADEIKAILAESGVHLKAMILLGINCAFGSEDCSQLRLDEVDLDEGWIDNQRPKTEVERRCPLWPETINAMRESFQNRPEPANDAHSTRWFLKPGGTEWVTQSPHVDTVARKFTRAANDARCKRKGVGFYSLRRTFATIASETEMPISVGLIMGHADQSMGAKYRQKPPTDENLRAVAAQVRNWLYGGSHE